MSTFADKLPEFGHHRIHSSGEVRWRHRFSLITVLVTLVLIGWGALVTSIDAGLAVPDWPATFGSYDPFATGFSDPDDPAARWWHSTPVLAEHGHRLLGALVGLLTLVLAVWTWRADPRRWMRVLGLTALALVIVQGVLGGLRVVWLSLDLAVVHAFTAQVFISLLVGMTLFTAPGWLNRPMQVRQVGRLPRLRTLTFWTVIALYAQIILGALLRHPGLSVDPIFAGVHIGGAFVVTGFIFAAFAFAWRYYGDAPLIQRAAWGVLGVVALQFMLGLAAYAVILYETPLAMRSVAQVALTIVHVVVGSILVAVTICLLLLSLRQPQHISTGVDTRIPAHQEPTADPSLKQVN